MEFNFEDLNYIAIVVAVVAGQAFGALWYSPLLMANPWMEAIGTTKEEIEARPDKARPFVIAIGGAIIGALALALILEDFAKPDMADGLLLGAVLGIGVFAVMDATHKAFSGNNLTHFLIDGGHTVITFLIWGAIIGAWD